MRELVVFYNSLQSVSSNESFSPSAGKPELTVERFRNNPRVKIVSDWAPISREELYAAHDPRFVNGVLDLEFENGFRNKSARIAESLHYTVGSFYNAAKYALEHRTVVCSPTSGFHHSHFDYCHGFCTFNGLMVAAINCWRNGLVDKIGIIDFDAHYGDGTVDIIERIGVSDLIEHLTFGGFATYRYDFDKWLDGLEEELVDRFSSCDILFYQAGADPHKDDPLGGYLTTEQMCRRDEIVFRAAKRLRKPIVWNLAGGYQKPIEKVLDLHNNTLTACLDYYLGDEA